MSFESKREHISRETGQAQIKYRCKACEHEYFSVIGMCPKCKDTERQTELPEQED